MCLFLQAIRLLCLSNRIFSNYVCIAGGREEYQRGFFQLFYSFIINTGNNGIGQIVFFHETQQGFQLAWSVVVSVCPLNLYSPIRLLLCNIQADNVNFTLLFCIDSPICIVNVSALARNPLCKYGGFNHIADNLVSFRYKES